MKAAGSRNPRFCCDEQEILKQAELGTPVHERYLLLGSPWPEWLGYATFGSIALARTPGGDK